SSPAPLARTAGSDRSRFRRLDCFGLAAGGSAARGLADLFQLRERALSVNRAFAVGVEGLPGDALRIGDPLLVGFGVAAGRVFGLDDRPLGAAEAVIHFCQLGLVFGLDAEMRDARGTARAGADREIHPRVLRSEEHTSEL